LKIDRAATDITSLYKKKHHIWRVCNE